MPSESQIRASDADRDHAASLLQEHHAAGRLTAEEFTERMEAALRARTLGELDELLADLPHVDLRRYSLPDASLHRPPGARSPPGGLARSAAVRLGFGGGPARRQP